MFENTYAVCYTGNKERHAHLMKELVRIGISDIKVIWDYPTPYKNFLLNLMPHIPDLANRPGTWGASLAHYRAIKTAYELGQDRVLFVEDDCRFLKDFAKVRETVEKAPADWDILLLDHFDTFGCTGAPMNGWLRFAKSHSAACYMLSRKAMSRLIDLYESPVNGKYSRPLMRLCDHWTNQRYLGPDIVMYCAAPNLAIQCDCSDASNCGVMGGDHPASRSYAQYGLDLSAYQPYSTTSASVPSAVSTPPAPKVELCSTTSPSPSPAPEAQEAVDLATVDIIYIVGPGAKDIDDRPLRWSLRSLAKHGRNIGRVIVAGQPPKWLSDKAVKVEADVSSKRKHWNMLNGIAVAMRQAHIDYPCLFSSDDHYLCRDADMAKWPRFERGWLLSVDEFVKRKGKAPNKYMRSLCDTKECLALEHLSTRKACLHYNTWMDGRDLDEVLAIADRHKNLTTLGFEPTCLFNAVFEKKHPKAVFSPVPPGGDGKIHVASDIDAKIKAGALGFSTSPNAEKDAGVVARMNALYPTPSPWES